MRRPVLIASTVLAFVAASVLSYTTALGERRRAGESRAALPDAAVEPAVAQADAAALGAEAGDAKGGMYQWLRAHGLGAVGTMIKRTGRAMPWVVFFLLLERLIPAKPIRSVLSVNKLQDFLYPAFASSIRVGMLLVGYDPARQFTALFLPLVNFRLLDGLPMFWQALGGFLAVDLTHWLTHFARHKIGWLWRFHSIHHSQVELNPLSAFRSHPLEGILIGLSVLVPAAIFGGDKSSWIIVGLLSGPIWPMLSHANLKTNLGPLRYVLVSPQFHRVHHSVHPGQYDHNYGEQLIVWDWLFGTMWKDAHYYPDTGIVGGQYLEERSRTPMAVAATFGRHFFYPFLMIGRSIRDAALRRPAGEGSEA
jgi:sterol desaturase/sphingolipid hydroxylase (fatty acid hydroxylase superfamily)